MDKFALSMRALNLRLVAAVLVSIPLFALIDGAQADETPRCHYVNLANLPIRLANGHLVVQGAINGQAIATMIDTGAQNTQLTGKGADDLGLPLEHRDGTTMGFGGESVAHTTIVDDISLDRLHIRRRMHLLVTADVAGPYGAIVGADILLNKDMEFSLASQQIKFFEPKGCDETFLAYWDKNASAIPMSEMSAVDHRQFVTVEVNGKKMRALIDTGSPYSLIDLAAAARVGVTPQSPGARELGAIGGAGKHQVKAWIGSFDTFMIGDETTRNAKIGMMDLYGALKADSPTLATVELADQQPEMILGLDFLRVHHVLFALSQRRLYFSYLGGNVFQAEQKPVAPN